MRDIVVSRARTLDDPLTTRVLAEIARSRAMSETNPQHLHGRAETVKIAPLAATSSESPSHPRHHDIAMPRRRTVRRPISREEPFRKK
jgi:hypothetical protein